MGPQSKNTERHKLKWIVVVLGSSIEMSAAERFISPRVTSGRIDEDKGNNGYIYAQGSGDDSVKCVSNYRGLDGRSFMLGYSGIFGLLRGDFPSCKIAVIFSTTIPFRGIVVDFLKARNAITGYKGKMFAFCFIPNTNYALMRLCSNGIDITCGTQSACSGCIRNHGCGDVLIHHLNSK